MNYNEDDSSRFDYEQGWIDALESAAKLVEEDLRPEPVLNPYKAMYNRGIQAKAAQIRALKWTTSQE